jgi:hypothetical protein
MQEHVTADDVEEGGSEEEAGTSRRGRACRHARRRASRSTSKEQDSTEYSSGEEYDGKPDAGAVDEEASEDGQYDVDEDAEDGVVVEDADIWYVDPFCLFDVQVKWGKAFVALP